MSITSRNKKPLTILLMIALSIPLASILTAFPAPVQAQNPTGIVVDISPQSTGPLAVGSFFDVFVEINNVPTSDGLTGTSGTVRYNTLVLNAVQSGTGVSFGSICAPAGACESSDPGTVNNALGQVSWETFFVGYGGTGFTGSGTMLRVHFQVISKGTSSIIVGSNPPNSVSDPKTGEMDEVALADIFFNLNVSHQEIDGTFFVNPAKTAPTAVLSCLDATGAKIPCPTSIPVKSKLVFTGAQSHDNNVPPQTITTYTFSVNGAQAQSGAQTSFSFSQTTPGSYKVCLVVTNFSGLSSTPACDTVMVTAVKNAPTAVLNPTGPLTVNVKTKTTFDGSRSFDNSNPVQPLTYAFSVNGVMVQSGTSPTYSFSTNTPGPYNVCLVVTNTSNLSSSPACTAVTVNAVKNAPTAVLLCDSSSGVAGPCPAKMGVKTKLTFDGGQSHDNSNPVQQITNYAFSVNSVVVQSGTVATFSFTPQATGSYTICLVVSNSSGMSSTAACVNIMVNPVKAAPTAVLLCDTTPGTAPGPCPTKVDVKTKISFDGSRSTDNSNPVQPLTYAFSVNGVVVQSGTSATFSFSTGTPGTYNVCLVVTNTSLLSSSPACTSVMVNAVKNGPTAVLQCQTSAGVGGCPTKIPVKTKVTFDASASHDNSNPPQALTYAFSVNGVVVQSGASTTFSFSTGTPGPYQICVTVTNTSGLFISACTPIEVNAVKSAPTAIIIAPDKANVKAKVLYDGSTSHDNSNPAQTLTYTWTDPTGLVLGTGPTLSQTYNVPGSYTVNLQVCNTSMLCNSTSHTVMVNAVKVAPTAVLSCINAAGKGPCPTKVDFKTKIMFDGSQSHDNSNPLQSIVKYVFTVNGNMAQSSDVSTFSFTATSPGVYNVCLVVFNSSGLFSPEACVQVTVNAIKNAPTAVLDCIGSAGPGPCPAKIDTKTKVIFDGSGSTDNSNPLQPIVRYVFSVNGTIAQSGPNSQFSFTTTTPGVYAVCLVVFNQSGLHSGQVCVGVAVNAVKRDPTAVITGPAKVTEGDNVVYDGSRSHDNSNPPQPLTYTWFDKTTGLVLGTAAQQKITFGPPGTFDLSLRVCNTSGLCNTANLIITINTRKLPVTATLVPPKAGAAYTGAPATFVIRISGGTPPFVCTLSFGDGTATQTISPCVDGQTVSHTYTASGSFIATLKVTEHNICGTAPCSSTSTTTIDVQPAPLFISGKLSWKHHLTAPGIQTFTAKISNPSKFTVQVTVHLVITKPDGTTDTVDGGPFTLGPGVSNTSAMFTYTASMLGKYCFTATVHYTVDVNGDGITDITGVGPNSKSGCFNRV